MSALKQAAQHKYTAARNNGQPLTPSELADTFDRSEQWAIDLINDIESGIDQTTITDEQPQPNSPDNPTPTEQTTAIATKTTTPSAPATPQPKPDRGSYLAAWTALFTGITVSIAGNVLHVMANSNTPAAWLVAAFWPIALLLSVEVITRVTWPTGTSYAITRYGGTGIVAVVAAVVSYRHMSGLLTHWGEDPFSAHLGPLAIDGLVVVGTTALMAITKHKKGR